MLVSHNTRMGAAKGAILVAEYLAKKGYIGSASEGSGTEAGRAPSRSPSERCRRREALGLRGEGGLVHVQVAAKLDLDGVDAVVRAAVVAVMKPPL